MQLLNYISSKTNYKMKTLLFIFLSAYLNSAQEVKFSYDLGKVVFEANIFEITPEVKGNVNSITFTPDGKEVYFSYINESRKVKIYFSKYINGKWSEAKQVDFSSDKNDNNPFITYDGSKMYFASQRGLEYNPSKNDYDIWFVERIDTTWGKPTRINLAAINSNANEGTPVLDKNGNLYFSSSREGGYGKNDIYLAKFNGEEYTEIINLGSEINSSFDDFYPMVDSESNFILFSSYRGEGNGLAEIYFAELVDFKPQNLKALNSFVNTEGYEYAPYLDPSNKYIFFTRISSKQRKIMYINKEVVGVNFNIER